MIDFRYHLVSIVAVFLALGVGLVLGSTALQPSVLAGLEKASTSEKQQIDSLLATKSQLKQQIAGDGHFVQAVAPQLLQHLLDGQWVVVVRAPGAPNGVTKSLVTDLRQAGAMVTGQVDLQPKFFDMSSSTQADLSLLAEGLAPIGMSATGPAQTLAGRVLASALLTRDGAGQPAPGQRDTTTTAILNGFAGGGFLTASAPPRAHATLAVVITPGSPPAGASSQASQLLAALAQQLGEAGQGTVLAGTISGSGQGSAIDVLRGGDGGKRLSTVDDADTAIGQIVVIQALNELLRGVSGNYGATSAADAAGPSPAPSPSPTASATTRTASRRSSQATPRPSASRTP